MNMPNASQFAAAGRHVLTYSMGAVTMLATVGVFSSDDAATISGSITHISHGVAEIMAAISPLVAIASGFYSVWSASHKSQVAAVNLAIDERKAFLSPGENKVVAVETPKTV